MRYLEENEASSNEMLLLIKQSGSTADRWTAEPSFMLVVMGKANQSPYYAESYANLLYASMLNFDPATTANAEDTCVISCDPTSGVNGAYKTESGRYAYDMDFTLKVGTGGVL